MNPAAIVLHGPTSAGKSSLAHALQNNAKVPAFHVSLDAFGTMSRRRDMRSAEEEQRAYRLHCENLRSTLARLVETEFEIIVDLVLRDEPQLQDTFRVLAPRPIYLVGVRAALEVLEEREQRRDDRASEAARAQITSPAFRRAYDLVIDTSKYSIVDGADAIRRFINYHPRRAGLVNWPAVPAGNPLRWRQALSRCRKGRCTMRQLGIAILVVALLSACATQSGGSGESSGADRVRAATDAWRAAYDSRDPVRIAAMYAPDAALWGTTARTVAASQAAISDYFKDAGKRPNARVSFGEQHIRVYGDIGVNTGVYTFLDVRDGKAISAPARFTLVFQNRHDKWLIVAHHSSRVP